MSATNGKNRKSYHRQNSDQQLNSIFQGIFECYNVLAKNEYPDETIGLQAFLMRKSVGSINFSELIDDSDKRSRQGHVAPIGTLLEERRKNLPANEASIEKCMILNRLIDWIREDAQFNSILSNIRIDMLLRMSDNGAPKRTIEHPADFDKRVQDFEKRRRVQEQRRLFYFSNKEVDPVANLVQLQCRTTEQLTFAIQQLNQNSRNHKFWTAEIEKILKTSFLIVSQPHNDITPTTIYEKKSNGVYTAKISVFIVSLLYEFMQRNPNAIELYDIEPSLCPQSDLYRLDDPQTLQWRTCEFRLQPEGKTLVFRCAEMTSITIGQVSKSDVRVRFAQALHTFKFGIKVQVNLGNAKNLTSVNVTLETLPFAIAAHNNQVPQLLARLILDDIQRFTQPRPVEPKTIQNFVERFFIHRTGVRPNTATINFLEQELIKASNQRGQTLEENYSEFLVHFVHQVEFMAKHPILSVFHAEHLFLGICNSERAAEAMVQTCAPEKAVIGIRFNSIRVEYNSSSTSQNHRTSRPIQCAIRVDIYNDRTKKLQNRTFDSNILATDISKFVSTSDSVNNDSIRVLSSFDDKTNAREYLSFQLFSKYSDEKLRDISKSDDKYKPVTDLIDNATDASGDTVDENPTTNSTGNPDSVQTLPPLTPISNNHEPMIPPEHINNHEYATIGYGTASSTYAVSPMSAASPKSNNPQLPTEANSNNLLDTIFSNPNMINDLLRRLNVINVVAPIATNGSIEAQPQYSPNQNVYQNMPSTNQPVAMIPNHQTNHSLPSNQLYQQYPNQQTFASTIINQQQQQQPQQPQQPQQLQQLQQQQQQQQQAPTQRPYPMMQTQFVQSSPQQQYCQGYQMGPYSPQSQMPHRLVTQPTIQQYAQQTHTFHYNSPSPSSSSSSTPLVSNNHHQIQYSAQSQNLAGIPMQPAQFVSATQQSPYPSSKNSPTSGAVNHLSINQNQPMAPTIPTTPYAYTNSSVIFDEASLHQIFDIPNENTNSSSVTNNDQHIGLGDPEEINRLVEFLSESFAEKSQT